MLLLSIPLATYTIFLLILVAAVLKKNNKTDSVFADDISIVIPFRNEQHNLPALLESLKNQIFPGKIEIILVDDQSTDNSVGIVKDLKDQYPHTIVLLSSIFDPSKKMSSKQQALDLGIRSSKNPWIALTDADMQLQPQWLKSLISGISKDSGLVFGHTALLKPTSCFEHAQAFQLEFLFATAYAFYKCGIQGSCMGNNVLISKKAYLETGGHDAVGYSIVEDRALMSHFQKSGFKTGAVTPFLPHALTYPCKTWNEFQHQMKRWAIGGFNWKSNLLPIGFLFLIQNIILLVSVFYRFSEMIAIHSWINFIITWYFVSVTLKKIGSTQKPLWFPLFYLFLQVEVLLFLTQLLFKRQVVWKNREV